MKENDLFVNGAYKYAGMIMALLCGAFAAGDAAAAESAAAVTGTVISVDDRFGDVTVSVTPGDLAAAKKRFTTVLLLLVK